MNTPGPCLTPGSGLAERVPDPGVRHAAGVAIRRWLRSLGAALLVPFVLATPGVAIAGPEEVIARIKPSIVAVGTFERTRNPAFQFLGTGFAVGDGSMVATNAHVVPRVINTERREILVVAVAGPDGGAATLMPAKVLSTDRDYDLALLGFEGKPLPALPVPARAVLREGQTVLFTGYPIGAVLGLIPATHRAMVSALTPIIIPKGSAGELDAAAVKRLSSTPYTIIQLDGTAYPGNSGSPLYDESGALVGVINMVFVKGSRETAITQPSGISYAIPIQALADLIARRSAPP